MKLREVQDRSYELLCLVDDICRKENVPYFLDSGTELGSVREKDIIPWDDDIDIKVSLRDYPAFREAMRRRLPPHLRLVEPEEFAPRFYDFVPRIIDERFLLRKETEEDRAYRNLQNRVGIDVFLTYGIPAGGLRKKLAVARLLAVYGLGMGHRYRLDYTKYSLPQKIAAALLSTAGRLVPAKAVCRRYFRLITRYDRRYHDLYWKTYNDPKETIRREWTEETAEGELRGRKFPVPAGYDAELTALYGDYMQPPADRSAYQQHLDEEDRWREKTPSKEGQSA